MCLSRMATEEDSSGENSCYFLGLQLYGNHPYHRFRNPHGIIQMGLAENLLSLDGVQSWIQRNPDTVEFRNRNGASCFIEVALFQDYHGLPALKTALVNYMGARVRGFEFAPENLILTAGATPANETLMFCLANPGEAFILPTPYYPAFDRDVKLRPGVEIVPMHCSSSNGFRITSSALEQAYDQARNMNLRVKGVLITNPSNPLGTTMTKKEVKLLLHFAIEKNIHIVSDEVYSGTVFGSPRFTSIMEIMNEITTPPFYDDDDNNHIWNRVHVVYSLSKEFGIPGFRAGMIYSNNKKVVSAATNMSSFGLISSQTQYLLANLLHDKRFTLQYKKVSKRRLKNRKEMLVNGLREAGIECLKSNAGLFCWVDMRHLLRTETFEAEIELWIKIIRDVGLNITPGSSFHCCEPGWFRICFANMTRYTLHVALRRIKDFIADFVVVNTALT